jgi:hypothetical protein
MVWSRAERGSEERSRTAGSYSNDVLAKYPLTFLFSPHRKYIRKRTTFSFGGASHHLGILLRRSAKLSA